MAKVLPRTRETVSVGGVGNLTPGGAVAGAQTFASALTGLDSGPNSLFAYWIEDGTAWEYGYGYLDSTTGDIVRAIFGGSSTGSALDVSTSAEIYSADAPVHDGGRGVGIGPNKAGAVHFSSHWADGSPPSRTFAADVLYTVPYKIEFRGSVDALTIAFGSTIAGTKARLGIYRWDADNYTFLQAGSLITETVDITPVASTLVHTALPSPVHLAPGWYMVAYLADGSNGLVAHDYNLQAANPYGRRKNSGMFANTYDETTIASGWTSLPDPAPARGINKNNNYPPAIGMRVA